MDAELVHHLLTMLFNSLNADAQFGCDLFICPALRNELQNLGFTGGKVISATAHGLAADKGFAALIAQALGNRRTEICIPTIRFTDGLQQIVGGRLFDQIASRTSLGELLNVFVVTVRRENEDLC